MGERTLSGPREESRSGGVERDGRRVLEDIETSKRASQPNGSHTVKINLWKGGEGAICEETESEERA